MFDTQPPKAKQYKSLAATSVGELHRESTFITFTGSVCVCAGFISAVILLFIIYNKVAITIFSIFNVYPDPIDGHYFLKADYTVEVR